MADSNTTVDGLIVEVSADTSKLTGPLAATQQQFNQFTQGLSKGLDQSTASMAKAEAAANTLGNSTKNLGEAISETGSRRELRESLVLMQGAAMGTGGALEILRVGLVTFASSMGGPVLIAIAAGVAALAALYEGIKNYNEEQKVLNETSAMWNLPVDQIKNMTSAMKELANQISSVQMGFSHLSQAQFDLLKQLGLDPSKVQSAQQAFTTIYNSSASLQDKIQQFGILVGAKSTDDAQKAWDKFFTESEEKSHSWLERIQLAFQAAGQAEAGDLEGQAKTLELMGQTKGQALGLNANSSGNGPKAKTQQQIDDAKALQDLLTSLTEKGAQARISAMTNEADKIIAEAQLETQRLEAEKQKQLDAHKDDPDAQAKISAGYNQTIGLTMAEAQAHAQQVTHQLALDEQTKFNTEMSALVTAAASSDIKTNMTASEAIVADGQARIAALKKQLDDYINSPEFQKLAPADRSKKASDLTSQFNQTSSTISSNADVKAQQVANEEKLSNEKQFQSQMDQIDKESAQARISLIDDPAQRAQAEGDLRLQEYKDRLQQELDALQEQLDKKKISEETYEQEVSDMKAKYAGLEQTQAQATAKAVLMANPVNSLLASWQNLAQNMQSLTANAMNSIAGAFAQLVVTGKANWAQLTESILTDLAKIVIEKQIAGIVGSFMPAASGGAGSGGSGPLIGGGMAGGGTVQAGVPIPVGERGPELFVPNTGGTILNNSSVSNAAGGGGTPNITIQMQTNGTPQAVKSAAPSMSGRDMIVNIMLDDIRTSGPISGGLQQSFGLSRKAYQ
jgi:lambda family phage tail tape measure protein